MSGINVRAGICYILLTHKHGYVAKSETEEYQGRPFCCDLSQNPETIPRHGELLPSICRSSFNYIPGKDHFVTEGECEVSMGVPNSTLLPTSLEYEHLGHWNSERQAQTIASGHLTADKLTGAFRLLGMVWAPLWRERSCSSSMATSCSRQTCWNGH